MLAALQVNLEDIQFNFSFCKFTNRHPCSWSQLPKITDLVCGQGRGRWLGLLTRCSHSNGDIIHSPASAEQLPSKELLISCRKFISLSHLSYQNTVIAFYLLRVRNVYDNSSLRTQVAWEQCRARRTVMTGWSMCCFYNYVEENVGKFEEKIWLPWPPLLTFGLTCGVWTCPTFSEIHSPTQQPCIYHSMRPKKGKSANQICSVSGGQSVC